MQKKDKPIVDIGKMIRDRAYFPSDVMREAGKMPQFLTDAMIRRALRAGRRDLRALETVTIDSEDTKDVDDAVSVERLADGTWRLGVHIADVAHYVTAGSALDREAYRRGTSVYLVDKVLPMLPRALSNGICSLNEGADRLALSVEMRIDGQGNIIGHEIFESIIRVHYKISYNQLYALLSDDDTPLRAACRKQYGAYFESLRAMQELAALRKAWRRARGALDFDLPETKVTVDETGRPTAICAYHTTFANAVIEEFMLAANETVAEHFYWLDVPFMYRNHAAPEAEKIQILSESVRAMGFTLKGRGGEIHTHAIQSMLDQCSGRPTEQVVRMLTLRAMQKAEYSPRSGGHFGLASACYTHFTSPIRRYPDLFIHRVIKLVLHGALDPETENGLRETVFEAGEHCSQTEREAELAERQYTDMKVAEYMADFVGETFPGIISGITSFGIFVRLANAAEGLVFYNTMPDYMLFDPKRMIARGERTKRTYAIGDSVWVRVTDVSVASGQIAFTLCRPQTARESDQTHRGNRA